MGRQSSFSLRAKGFNIIGSHVVYQQNSNGAAKAQIVLWGHIDNEKNDFRSDACSSSIYSMITLLSLPAENKKKLCKMDVESAYLQARQFKRGMYVCALREEKYSTDLLNLLVTVYGLTESERLWHLRSSELSIVLIRFYNRKWIHKCTYTGRVKAHSCLLYR